MKSFSQRNELSSIRVEIQIESIDEKLRIRLWNDIYGLCFKEHIYSQIANAGVGFFFNFLYTEIWTNYFIKRSNDLPKYTTELFKLIEDYFFRCKWNELFDFIEFRVQKTELSPNLSLNITEHCNNSLEKELSGYRIVNGQFVLITSQIEIAEIETAVNSSEISNPVKTHLKRALELLSDRTNPDYRNSIKESKSAIEALCIEITGSPKATLGEALKNDKIKSSIHGGMQKAISNLYGYTSNADGIRHALMDETTLKQEDAMFMLVSCSAFVNYLKVKVTL